LPAKALRRRDLEGLNRLVDGIKRHIGALDL
jgi:hypothetical protein